MMFESLAQAPSTETPWGLSWEELLPTLRPSEAELGNLSAVAATVEGVLSAANIGFQKLIPGGAYGKGTLMEGEKKIDLYAVFEKSFSAEKYFDTHLKPMTDALKKSKSVGFADVSDKGLAVHFSFEGFKCRLFAAGVLYAGPRELLLYETPRPTAPSRASASFNSGKVLNGPAGDFPESEARDVHVETTCAVLRIQLIQWQSLLYKDMVRVAKKWRASCDFTLAEDAPGDYLIELLMMEACNGAPCAKPSPDLYSTIFRRFLALCSQQSGSGSDVLADDAVPKSFLSWTTFYNQGAIDYGITNGLLRTSSSVGERCALVVVDPAVPFVNVAKTVGDWGELRKFARESLSQFQNTEILETLQTRLNTLSEGMGEVLKEMQKKIDYLESLEDSPRRWSGNIQFREAHFSGETWAVVTEVELRRVVWRLNARKARSDNVGYSSFVDVSLQMIGKPLTRTVDVDVHFRNGTSNLVFGPDIDHVIVARRSDVIRNREYPIQITIVA